MANPDNLIKPTRSKTEGPGMKSVGSNAIGSGTVTTAKPAPQVSIEDSNSLANKVAVYSTRNVFWDGVGRIKRGYNIMTQEKAEKWLTRDHARLASPEEVAKEYDL
jgi:hypothetical protein